MKILNQTIRDAADLSHQMTAVSELQPTSELKKESLLHIIQYLDNGGPASARRYESMRMTVEAFENKIYQAVQNTFKTAYWDTHEKNMTTHGKNEGGPTGTSFKDFLDYLKGNGTAADDMRPTEVAENNPDGFISHIYFDFDVIKRYIVKKNNKFQSEIDRIDNKLTELDCYFDPDMKLYTTDVNGNTLVNDSVNHRETENDTYCQMEIKDGNKISNTWTVPASGNLVIYGWLDSSAALNNKATPSAFCVIEAKINSTPTQSDDVWEIIAAQPVQPFKNITYVGFNLLVHEGLVIRARTGFTVGAKSSQFSNENDGYDTLANIALNGFKCQVFSNVEYKNKKGE